MTSVVDPPMTTAGMLPILQAPADDNDTLTTVINRFIAISTHLGQEHTIITADQPLYSRGKELTWANPKFGKVIFLLGGLHITFNFLKAIGQHMESAGLDDLWTEAGVYATNTTDSMLDGKAYYRAVRGHQLTYEALWRIKWPLFQKWLSVNSAERGLHLSGLAKDVTRSFKEQRRKGKDACGSVSLLSDFITQNKIHGLVREFDRSFSDNPNFVLWSTYMEMVEVLLDFIRSERDGNWNLHLETFEAMLPWLTVYDHTNYARWGPVYLSDMRLLSKTAPSIHAEFAAGNFVVKRSKRCFNQVSADHATEWINRICKMHSGIIGITRNDQARNKFCVTWAERSRITQDMRSLYNLADEEDVPVTRVDGLSLRREHDIEDVGKLTTQLVMLDVFGARNAEVEGECCRGDSPSSVREQCLVSLATRDVATPDVMRDLMTAEKRGKQQVISFVKERLIEGTIGFHATMKKNRSHTFADLYKTKITTTLQTQKTIKADRKLMQRLLNAVTGGRSLEMASVLEHELSPIPLSLANSGGELNSTPKAELISALMGEVHTPSNVPDTNLKTCLLIDGHALIQSLGKPRGCRTFGEYADVFTNVVTQNFGKVTTRVDVVFDRYIGGSSIKAATRERRVGKKKPIRKLIDGPHTLLPQTWNQFIALDENKADLAAFLSTSMMERCKTLPEQYELVTGGGFSNGTEARSSRRNRIPLQANHEEADTRLILHSLEAVRRGFERIVVQCRDTDVMVLLIHFVLNEALEVWMISGNRQQKCYPLHELSETMSQSAKECLIGFHALTGCDTTSSFRGYGKKSCWKVFLENPLLVKGIGRDGELEPIEQFVCQLYGTSIQANVNSARLHLFGKAKKGLEMLPPRKDALQLHVERANYQAKVWLQADREEIVMPFPASTPAWKLKSGRLVPIFTSIPPIPVSCLELVSCSCKSKCSTARCSCFKNDFKCTFACACEAINCCNPAY
ncbi:uncharacterized protein [Diadema antillarum]|uniref:uncharacterized protein n=1 Tax=Diadema antillarum TaxID=105358 RepID=UPI003A84A11C